MSADLCWQIIRDNHAHLLKKRNVKKPFSTEANNLKNVNSPRYNGICKKKVIGIEPAAGGKGIILSHKTSKYQNKPGKNLVKTTIKAGPRRALNSIRRFIKFNHYRKDLKKAALRRASAILRSQRAQPFKKARRRTHKVAKKTTE
ncbi:60S ribosomal protein L28-like [Homarus americanus]|uniref:60S ribosomal protein L28-like n=1 Tax=Homarus americanus TaxID=6706 RepID=UPI001C4597BA|nr:60S ribosomal protein L28-like [Homarus americanus]